MAQDQSKQTEQAQERARVAQESMPDEYRDMMTLEFRQPQEQTLVSGDPRIAAGQIQGLTRAQQIYGMTPGQIGDEVQDIVSRRRQRLAGQSPEDTAMRQQRNREIRRMRAEGRSPAQIEEMRRGYSLDLAREGYKRESQALTDYQKLIGNVLGGTSSLEMGMASLEKAGETAPTPSYQTGLSSMFGTVICTELFNQGYLSEKIYKEDAKYGQYIRRSNPHVYIGYRILADPIVALMKLSPVFTWFVALWGVAWARNMAGYENGLGKFVNIVGEPVCKLIGKIKERYDAKRQVQSTKA